MLSEEGEVLSEGEVYKVRVCKVMEVEVCVRWVYSHDLPSPVTVPLVMCQSPEYEVRLYGLWPQQKHPLIGPTGHVSFIIKFKGLWTKFSICKQMFRNGDHVQIPTLLAKSTPLLNTSTYILLKPMYRSPHSLLNPPLSSIHPHTSCTYQELVINRKEHPKLVL